MTKKETKKDRKIREELDAVWRAKVYALAHPNPGDTCGDPGCECWQEGLWPAPDKEVEKKE